MTTAPEDWPGEATFRRLSEARREYEARTGKAPARFLLPEDLYTLPEVRRFCSGAFKARATFLGVADLVRCDHPDVWEISPGNEEIMRARLLRVEDDGGRRLAHYIVEKSWLGQGPWSRYRDMTTTLEGRDEFPPFLSHTGTRQHSQGLGDIVLRAPGAAFKGAPSILVPFVSLASSAFLP